MGSRSLIAGRLQPGEDELESLTLNVSRRSASSGLPVLQSVKSPLIVNIGNKLGVRSDQGVVFIGAERSTATARATTPRFTTHCTPAHN